MNNKYELLQNDTKQHNGRTLYRIKALVANRAIAHFLASIPELLKEPE